MTCDVTRRGFLRAAAVSGAALVVGFGPDGGLATELGATDALNPFVKIALDDTVTVVIKHFEMGQGTTTGLATLVAEELDVDWEQVSFEYAPSDNSRYANLLLGVQGTGGSTAMANSFLQYRQAGAAARAVLVQAGPDAWGRDPGTLTVRDGVISDGTNVAGFGELIAAAAALPLPEEPVLKDPADFTLIGRDHLPRKDTPDKINGAGRFATDVHLPGMVVAVILSSPKLGGLLTGFDASDAEGLPGFRVALALPNNAGIAVYGDTTWAAFQAREAITADGSVAGWDHRIATKCIFKGTAMADWVVHDGVDHASVEGGGRTLSTAFPHSPWVSAISKPRCRCSGGGPWVIPTPDT